MLGPFIVFEDLPGLDDIPQSDIDDANILKAFYVKPFGIVTKDNLSQLVRLGTDAIFQ